MSIEQWKNDIAGCFTGDREADLQLLEKVTASSWRHEDGSLIRRAVLRLLPDLLTAEELADLRGENA